MTTLTLTSEKLIDELNLLILKNIDASRGFLAAAYNLSFHPLKEVFMNCSTQRHSFVEELQEEIKKLGGMPTDEFAYPFVGKGLWADTSLAVNSDSEFDLWNACINGEHHMVSEYDFLLNSNLPERIEDMIEIQKNVVTDTLAMIKMLEMAA